MSRRIGVLALQGAFREHRKVIETLGHVAVEIRLSKDLDNVHGLIIPGGESTTMGKLLQFDDLGEKVKELAAKDLPIFGTCAGMILLAKTIVDSNQYRLGLMDITVKRNAFGRQIASFEADLEVPALGREPFRAVFIRAPYALEVAPNVGILAEFDHKIVFMRQGNLIAAAFHPELTPDYRIHQYFIDSIENY